MQSQVARRLRPQPSLGCSRRGSGACPTDWWWSQGQNWRILWWGGRGKAWRWSIGRYRRGRAGAGEEREVTIPVVVVFPKTMAPASRARLTAVFSRAKSAAPSNAQAGSALPHRVGRPSTCMMSLTPHSSPGSGLVEFAGLDAAAAAKTRAARPSSGTSERTWGSTSGRSSSTRFARS
jgi:hypothetical protein